MTVKKEEAAEFAGEVAESYEAVNREAPQEGVTVLGHVDRPAEEPVEEEASE